MTRDEMLFQSFYRWDAWLRPGVFYAKSRIDCCAFFTTFVMVEVCVFLLY